MDVKGRSILLVEDIVDTGNTLKYLLRPFRKAHRPAIDVKICSLLDKPGSGNSGLLQIILASNAQ